MPPRKSCETKAMPSCPSWALGVALRLCRVSVLRRSGTQRANRQGRVSRVENLRKPLGLSGLFRSHQLQAARRIERFAARLPRCRIFGFAADADFPAQARRCAGRDPDQFKGAQRRWRNRRDWAALKGSIVGTVSALELTWSPNAHWHPHAHILLIVKAAPADAYKLVNGLRAGWLASLDGAGLHGGKAAWQLQDASAAGAYVAKWGAGEEMALHGAKSGRNGARTPLRSWLMLGTAAASPVRCSQNMPPRWWAGVS